MLIWRRSSAVSSMRPDCSRESGARFSVSEPRNSSSPSSRNWSNGSRNHRQIMNGSAYRGNLTCPQGVHLFHRGDDLVVGVPELVATRAKVLVAHLVDGDLYRCPDERGHDLPVVDVVRPRRPEIARFRRVAED